jgi:hypothetical protein
MSKILSVYLNDSEIDMLHGLQTVLNLPTESGALKVALKHLTNDHFHGEPAPDRVASELMIEVPAEVRLRSMMLSLIDECKKEVADQKASEEKEKKTAETAKRIMEWVGGKNA